MLENTLKNEVNIFPITVTMYRNEKYLSTNSKLMELIDQEETTGPQGIKILDKVYIHFKHSIPIFIKRRIRIFMIGLTLVLKIIIILIN